MNLKRIFTGIVCAAVAATSVVSPASAVMKHVGFDLSSLDERMGKVGEYFTEYVDGVRVRSEIRPTDFKWEAEGFEGVWPHAGYARLYALNSDTNAFEALDYTTYNATYANWATRWVNYDWDYLDIIANYKDCAECKAEGHTCIHFDKWTAIVWERQQTEIPGKGWTFDFGNRTYWDRNDATIGFGDNNVHRPAASGVAGVTPAGFPTVAGSVISDVEVQTYYKPLTVGRYFVANGAFIKDTAVEYFAIKALAPEVDNFYIKGETNVAGNLPVAALSVRDAATGRFNFTNKEIADLVPVVRSKYVVGPTFDNNGVINGTKVVNLWNEWLADFKAMAKAPAYTDPVVALGLAGRYTVEGQFVFEFDAEFDYNEADYYASIAYAMPIYADTAAVSEIAWTEPACEKIAPFEYYQYLTVCGIVFDGTNDKPAIVRYLGAYADPATASWADDYSAPVVNNASGLVWAW